MVRPHVIARVLALCLFALALAASLGSPAFALDYWLTAPKGWSDDRSTDGDRIRQIIDPDRNALIEVYAWAKKDNPGVVWVSDEFEKAMREKAVPLERRTGSTEGSMPPGVPTIVRQYSGTQDGTPMDSITLVAHHQGRVVVLFGIYVKGYGTLEKDVKASIATLRFAAPAR